MNKNEHNLSDKTVRQLSNLAIMNVTDMELNSVDLKKEMGNFKSSVHVIAVCFSPAGATGELLGKVVGLEKRVRASMDELKTVLDELQMRVLRD